MTTIIEAIYEDGVLRSDQMPQMENGARVRVTIESISQSNGTGQNGAGAPLSTRVAGLDEFGLDENGRVPFDPELRAKVEAEAMKNFDPERVKQLLRETAALPLEGPRDGFSGKDHDKILYGWEKDE